MFVLWSPLFDYLFLYVFICIFIYWLTYLKICMFGPPYHLFSFHMKNVTLFSGNAIRPHSSPAPVGASRRSPRPFLGGARAPRRFVAGVCMCVSLQEDDLLPIILSHTTIFPPVFSVPGSGDLHGLPRDRVTDFIRLTVSFLGNLSRPSAS